MEKTEMKGLLLVPCPFCGCDTGEVGSTRHVQSGMQDEFTYWVRCDKCGARGSCRFELRDAIEKGWNRRVVKAEDASNG